MTIVMSLLQTGQYDLLVEAVSNVFQWPTIGWIIIGILYGIFTGALPGIGASLGMALVLPLTLPLSGLDAIILLVSIYSGSTYGASTSAILINVPGSGSSAATTFDGYPMTRNGEAKTALGISATASSIGGLIGILTLLAISPFIIVLVLSVGTPEYFLVALMGLAMISVVAKTSIVKGTTAGAFGILVGSIGIAPDLPTRRFTFGTIALYDGLHYIAVLIGLFAIGELLKLTTETGGIAKEDVKVEGSIRRGIMAVPKDPRTLIKSAYIGVGVGAIPGAGSAVSNFVSYTEAVRSSDTPEKFGTGYEQGVIASETSNNALIGGALIPTFSFGIPGGGATAVLLGGLIMHGLRPGPRLFTTNIDITYSVYVALIVGNLIIFTVGILIISRASYITKIDTNIITPVVVVLALLGALTLRHNLVDVGAVLVFGVIGYFMRKQNYSYIALILGVILGPIAEQNLLRSLQISSGSFMIFVERWTSALLLFVTIFVLISPVIPVLKKSVVETFQSIYVWTGRND